MLQPVLPVMDTEHSPCIFISLLRVCGGRVSLGSARPDEMRVPALTAAGPTDASLGAQSALERTPDSRVAAIHRNVLTLFAKLDFKTKLCFSLH